MLANPEDSLIHHLSGRLARRGFQPMLTVICPSRGRPGNVARLIDSFLLTRVRRGTQLIVAIDGSDESAPVYANAIEMHAAGRTGVFLLNVDPSRRNMVQTLNQAASYEVGSDEVTMLGFVGDDHLFETGGWDGFLLDRFEHNIIAYGDDGHQHENLPTAVFL